MHMRNENGSFPERFLFRQKPLRGSHYQPQGSACRLRLEDVERAAPSIFTLILFVDLHQSSLFLFCIVLSWLVG